MMPQRGFAPDMFRRLWPLSGGASIYFVLCRHSRIPPDKNRQLICEDIIDCFTVKVVMESGTCFTMKKRYARGRERKDSPSHNEAASRHLRINAGYAHSDIVRCHFCQRRHNFENARVFKYYPVAIPLGQVDGC